MSSQDIKETIEQLTASGKAYVVATVVRTEAPSSANAGDRAVLDEDGILAGWVGGGCAKPAVTSNGLGITGSIKMSSVPPLWQVIG